MWARWLLVLLLLWPALLQASHPQVCGPRKAILDQLKNRFKESQIGIGLTSDGNVVEVFASAEGNWTIIVTSPTGSTCVVESGEGWQHGKPPDVGLEM